MSMKDRIVPVVREYTGLDQPAVVLGYPGKADFTVKTEACTCDTLVSSADELVRSTLGGLLNVCSSCAEGKVTVTLKLGEAPADVKNADQGYAIDIADNAVTLTGFGPLGLYYAAVTLSQICVVENGKLALEACRIVDWPDLRTRGHFMESRFGSNTMTLKDWEGVVDHMASMKQNQLIVSVYGCWCVQYDGRVSEYLYLPIRKYPELQVPVVKRYWSPRDNRWIDEEALPPMVQEDFFGDLIAYGKTKGVEVFPLFNSYGHNTLIPRMIPEVSAKEEDGTPTLHGFCTRNDKTYEVMFNIYDEIIDRYLKPNGITSFHMGLDEVHGGIANNAEDIFRFRDARCHCPKCRDAAKEELYIDHAITLMKHLKERGMKNIYMYSDMLVPHEWGDMKFDSTERLMKAIEENDLKDVAVIDWWTYADYQESLMFQSTRPEQGLRRIVKPWNGYYHWNIVTYPLKNIYLLGKMAVEEGCEGMNSYSAWDESYDRAHVAQADFSWCFANSGSIEDVTASYAKARFGAQYDKALRALRLQDKMFRTLPRERLQNDSHLAAPSSLLNSTLAYYFYSYVRKDKAYPRSFPGEAMATLLPNREDYESLIFSINAMACEAEVLWDEIAKDGRTDIRMARRYAWEARHVKVLTDDYLALFKMLDLYGDGKLCGCKAKKLAAIAGERKLARLALMDEFQRTKEFFLEASHLRNHSIFMQFFADLEAYLLNTAPEAIQLDFTDFSNVASDAFWKLR